MTKVQINGRFPAGVVAAIDSVVESDPVRYRSRQQFVQLAMVRVLEQLGVDWRVWAVADPRQLELVPDE